MTSLTGMLCRFWRCAAPGAGARARASERARRGRPASPDAAPPDDLTAIRGIGIAIQNRLNVAGIRTYAGLAAATPEEVRTILGTLARGADVEAWIAQAGELAKAEDA